MARATSVQTGFLGGEWSPYYQGRADDPRYRQGMNRCFNGLPMEEGVWVRRPGTRLKAPTYQNLSARVMPVEFTAAEPYSLEFTNGALRFYQGHSLVYTTDGAFTVSSIDTAAPAQITLSTAATWATGDEIVFFFDSAHPSGGLPLRQRVLTVTKIDTTNFTLTDPISGANIDGSTIALAVGTTLTARRILRLSTPYTSGSWANNRIVQNQDMAIVLNPQVAPYILTITAGATAGTADATLTECARHDGPYLDPVKNSVATLSSTTGTVVVQIAFAAWDSTKAYGIGEYVLYSGTSYKSLKDGNLNEQPDVQPTFWEAVDSGTAVTGDQLPQGASYTGFQATDVGRHIRFWITPADWDSATSYATFDDVTRNFQVYEAGVPNTNIDPVLGVTDYNSYTGLVWTPAAQRQRWTWGTITAVTNSTQVTVQLRGEDVLLFSGASTPSPVTIWRLGLYSDTTYWPATGVFYEGRFWLGGAVPNRFDTTKSQGFDKLGALEFAPTDTDGTVTDASGISYVLQSQDAEQISWFQPDHNDMICGTLGGEWMIQASTIGEPITPTSIRAKRLTRYGCADIEPIKAGVGVLFVQKYRRRVMEYLSDAYSGRYTAPHLNETAKHLTTNGIAQLAYQEELAPLLWVRIGDPP